MADWSLLECDYYNRYDAYPYNYYQEKKAQPVPAQCLPTQTQPYCSPSPTLTLLLSPSSPAQLPPCVYKPPAPKGENPREIRNKAEKQRRDKMNQSISHLTSIVPTVVKPGRKLDKTSILRLTAHYLRSHQHVFGNSIDRSPEFSGQFTQGLLNNWKGFLITVTYKGLVVVVSPNVQEYLGYSEVELLGQNVLTIIHQDDHQLLKDQIYPRSCTLGSNGELLLPKEEDAEKKVMEALSNEKRNFILRFKKMSHQRSDPPQYVTCHVEGSLRKSDRAGIHIDSVVHIGRRVRAKGENPFASGNDIVFIGMVRPSTETFITESSLESFRMEYRTRHSIDGEIIQCEQRIALVTGYMTQEVNGVNAMNFMHRDDVRWVVIALREMYDQHRLVGESCYRLMTKNGQFIYMRTIGYLDVDQQSQEATSFVCTNTVVAEQEGKHLIKLMKKKFTLMVNNNDDVQEIEYSEVSDKKTLPVEDPRQLEKVILHLVTNLPSPNPNDDLYTTEVGFSSSRLAIIPPRRERIQRAIERSYRVIKTLQETGISNTESIMYHQLYDPRIAEEEEEEDDAPASAFTPVVPGTRKSNDEDAACTQVVPTTRKSNDEDSDLTSVVPTTLKINDEDSAFTPVVPTTLKINNEDSAFTPVVPTTRKSNDEDSYYPNYNSYSSYPPPCFYEEHFNYSYPSSVGMERQLPMESISYPSTSQSGSLNLNMPEQVQAPDLAPFSYYEPITPPTVTGSSIEADLATQEISPDGPFITPDNVRKILQDFLDSSEEPFVDSPISFLSSSPIDGILGITNDNSSINTLEAGPNNQNEPTPSTSGVKRPRDEAGAKLTGAKKRKSKKARRSQPTLE